MVLGLRSKHRKDGIVYVNYLVHVEEIKPCPPLQSPGSTQSLLLQWENGDNASGFLTSGVIDSRVEFNKSFTLSLTLRRDKRDRDKFQKNYLEFYLYEPRKDKPSKGQLLGSAIVNLAEYGVFDNELTISASVNCKKSTKSMESPVLFLKLQSLDKDESNTSSISSLSKQSSLEKNGHESASEVTNEDELEIASFTDDDDDVPSHSSSQTVASSSSEAARNSSSQIEKNSVESTNGGNERLPTPPFGIEPATNQNNFPKVPERNMTSIRKEKATPFLQSSFSTMVSQDKNGEPKTSMVSFEPGSRSHGLEEELVDVGKAVDPQSVKNSFVSKAATVQSSDEQIQVSAASEITKVDRKEEENEDKRQISEDNLVGKFLASRKPDKLRSNTLAPSRKPVGTQVSNATNSRLKHLKSVQLPKSGGVSGNNRIPENVTRVDKTTSENGKSEGRSRTDMLEEELRETAAIEAGLYSIVAEHGSSTNKVHAPARRLSRFYIHACKGNHQERRANAAKAIISGLVLVSKSCGNDVPRLTFWLSNSVMLRAIVFHVVGESSVPNSRPTRKQENGKVEEPNDWLDTETFFIALEKVEAWLFSRITESVWWQTMTPHMQSTATNSRSMGLNSKKTSGSKSGLGNQQQGNFSMELWKKAFKDACERLCPIRAGGHECGCLPLLARLVMEQLVCRLDVAMFNAILRESAEEMPTDPLSDPIADLRVLPIPAGRSSFGAGAQLKNAIGTWSRWLTDLFGIEDNDSLEEDDDLVNDKRVEFDTSFKAFRLLHALSDLMMLPFEMLADKTTRKEFCPTFSVPLIKRVVSSFVPDEFSPKPIPSAVIDSLDAEDDSMEDSEETLVSFPCVASPIVYSPPPSVSLSAVIGDVGSQSLRRSSSSVLKKSYTSDDELDELDSPLNSIITDTSRGPSSSKRPNWTPKGGRSILRYQLLREVWKEGE